MFAKHTYRKRELMENLAKENHDDDSTQDEEFPEEFQCCVCLDLLYKPVVLACGHMACFWCIYQSMNFYRESHCPVCRYTYNHFPRSCRLLHCLLQKWYPSAYQRRQNQVAEEEERSGNVSQQFDSDKSASFLSEEVSTSIAPKTDSAGDASSSDSTSSTAMDAQKDGRTGTHKPIVASDLSCAICNQMLCQPVVLNCGDVYCEACIINSSDTVCKCPVCQSPHPNGFPSVCLILEHFLEEQFPEEYASRKTSSLKLANGHGKLSISSTKDQEKSAEGSSWWSGRGPKVHFGVGCDYCGMCPIIGERHRCKDCKEKMGFDLCDGCYNSKCKLPGRFNQQHTEDHQFETVEPFYLDLDHIIVRVGGRRNNEESLNNQNTLLMGSNLHVEEIGSIDMQGQAEGYQSLSNGGAENVGDTPEFPIILVDSSEDEGFYAEPL